MVKYSIKLHNFTTPNFVRKEARVGKRQDGIKFDEGIPLRDLEENTLSELCDAFRKEVFKKAGKLDPNEN